MDAELDVRLTASLPAEAHEAAVAAEEAAQHEEGAAAASKTQAETECVVAQLRSRVGHSDCSRLGKEVNKRSNLEQGKSEECVKNI